MQVPGHVILGFAGGDQRVRHLGVGRLGVEVVGIVVNRYVIQASTVVQRPSLAQLPIVLSKYAAGEIVGVGQGLVFDGQAVGQILDAR